MNATREQERRFVASTAKRKRGKNYRFRSAVTGQYVSAKFAEKHPREVVKELVE